MSSELICTKCYRKQISSNFVRNVDANTFFKTCITCRNRDKQWRQNNRRLRPIAPIHLESEIAGPSNGVYFFEIGKLIF